MKLKKLFLIFGAVCVAGAIFSHQYNTDILVQKTNISIEYNKDEIPAGFNKADDLETAINININSINQVKDNNLEISSETTNSVDNSSEPDTSSSPATGESETPSQWDQFVEWLSQKALVSITGTIFVLALTFFSKTIINVFYLGVKHADKKNKEKEDLSEALQKKDYEKIDADMKKKEDAITKYVDMKLQPLENIDKLTDSMKEDAISIKSDVKYMKEQANQIAAMQQTINSLNVRLAHMEKDDKSDKTTRRKNL